MRLRMIRRGLRCRILRNAYSSGNRRKSSSSTVRPPKAPGDPEYSSDELYSRSEQIRQLICLVYGLKPPAFVAPAGMPEADRQRYMDGMEGWMKEHPFVVQEQPRHRPSSMVFGGMLASEAFRSTEGGIAAKARHEELGRGAANPFLAEFYFAALESRESTKPPEVPAEHVGVLYASLRARLSSRQTANMRIESEGDEDKVDIVITKRNKGGMDKVAHRCVADAGGSFVFGRTIEGVSIAAHDAQASFGSGGLGGEAVFVAPVAIDVQEISFEGVSHVVARAPQGADDRGLALVRLRARSSLGRHDSFDIQPRHQHPARLEVSWPESDAPYGRWHAYHQDETEEDPELEEYLRSIGRFLRFFGQRQGGGKISSDKAFESLL